MQIQAMRYAGRNVRCGIPIVCATYMGVRHFWKIPSSKSKNEAHAKPIEKKETTTFAANSSYFKHVSKIVESEKKVEKSKLVKSIISGDLWKSYAEKSPEKEVPKASNSGEKPSLYELYDFDYYLSKIPSKFIDNRMKESLQDLAKLAEGVYNNVGKEPVHPMVLNIAILRMFAIQTHEENAFIDETEENGARAEISDQFAAETVHFFKFAEDVYEQDPAIIRQDIVLNQLEEKEAIHLPRHIVFLDHITKSIVVAIRGTASLSDMITDLYIDATPFMDPDKNVFAHKGIAESARAMLPTVTATINQIKQKDRGKYEKYRVVTTGHSLGAGSAALLAVLLSKESKIPVTCFAYAPPPIISKPDLHEPRFPFKFMNSDEPCVIHSFVHDRDFITRCSHRELLNMLSALTAIDSLAWTDFERSAAVFRNKLTDEEKSQIREVLLKERSSQVVVGNDVPLYIPGDIYLIRPVISKEVVTAEPIPEGKHSEQGSDSRSSTSTGTVESSSSSGGSDTSYSLGGAWQRVKSTVSAHGSGVMSSTVTDAKPAVSSAADAAAARDPTKGKPDMKDEKEKESERQREKLRLDRLQYEIIAVPSAGALFNGLLYYGDSMVNDHLITSYRRALLRMIK